MPPTPRIKRHRFDVWIAPEGTDPDTVADQDAEYHRVTVTHADELRGELEGSKRSLHPKRQPMAITSLWIWCAMVRAGLTTDRWETWRDRVLSYDAPDDDEQDGEGDDDDTPTGASAT